MRKTNGNFDSCNSCKQLGTSRLYELYESKFQFVSLPNLSVQTFRIFLLMYPGSLSEFGINPRWSVSDIVHWTQGPTITRTLFGVGIDSYPFPRMAKNGKDTKLLGPLSTSILHVVTEEKLRMFFIYSSVRVTSRYFLRFPVENKGLRESQSHTHF